MEKLGISIDDIDIIVISHNHSDHVGGDWGQKNTFSLTNHQVKFNEVKVYTPCEMNYPGLSPIHSAKPTKISEGVATIGVIHNPCFFMDIAEQSLAFNVKDKGIIIISGCGHHSVPKILARTNVLFNEPIFGLLGGLHYPVEVGRNITPILKLAIRKLPWEDFTIKDVKKDIELIKNSKIKIVGLSAHDSCDKSISAFKDEFGDEYYDIQVGKKISF
jgi:7,8-dihydropterin-6-yl-methyl-4-(beta-D-ribofuranosyl)aminobenzene 5'-phosphate synthase